MNTGDHLLLCVDRTDVTHDMSTFTFRDMSHGSEDHRPVFPFSAGQFISVSLVIDGREVQRCYSISSPPTRPDTLSITVKRVVGGHVSNWLHAHLETGMVVSASGPFGRFSYATATAEKYLFISAGSGITPVMSMLRAATDSATNATAVTDIVFIHSARTAADIPFRTELEDIAVAHPTVTVAFACTRTASDDDWVGERGRVDRPMLERVCPDLADREVYLCGPGRFRNGVRTALVATGASLTRIHEESFGFTLPVPEDDDHETSVAVDFARRARRVTVAPGSTILAAAAAVGVTLPSSCGVGLCGSCKVRKLSGDVVMNHQGGIRPREIEQGKILLCCSEPLSPVVIDL